MGPKLSLLIFGLFLLGIDCTGDDVRSSLTFVIDDTGSMSDDIKQVKEGVNDIFDTVMRSNSSQIEDFVLVTFNDIVSSPHRKNVLRTKTKDRNLFKYHLNSIDVDGGVDCPEQSMTGIKLGLQNSREGSSIFVFTDASSRDYKMYEEVEALSQKMGCQIVFVLTGTCDDTYTAADYLVYKKLAIATNGQVFHLGKTEIGKILKYVEIMIENRKYILASKTFPPGYGNKLNVHVDGDTKEIVISVSGQRPSVSVTNSEGTKLPHTDVTKLDETAVVKLVGLKPDLYSVEVGSAGETHVVVSGSTTVHFQHGFSTVSPSDIHDTVKRPVPGVKSFLSIKLSTEGDGIVKLSSVALLNMDDKVIQESRLKLVNATEQFYVTEQIMPPDHMFKVAITGFDVNTKTKLTRISLTPVNPQKIETGGVETKAPVVDCKAEVKATYGKPMELRCKVSGYPKPDVIWESDDKSAVFTHTVSTIEFPYDFVSVLNISDVRKNGTYTCKAVNSLGSGEGKTNVQTRRRFFEVTAEPKDTAVEYHKSAKITCKVDAYPPATVSPRAIQSRSKKKKQYIGMKPLRPDGNMELSADGSVLTIRSMEPTMADNYLCETRNVEKRKIFSFKLKISEFEAPEIDKKINKITAVQNSNVDMNCNVIKGKPKPNIAWYYKKSGGYSYTQLDETTDTLHLFDVDATNAGSYRCIAENVVNWEVHEIDLIVENKPSISRPHQSELTTDLGEAVTLVCPTLGEPAPRITWRHNGVPISSPVRHRVYADGTLRFYATSSDEGEYECEASNKHGVDRINYRLSIYVPVEIESPINSYIEQMEGSTVTLPCRADGSPKPSITWIFRSNDVGVRPSQLGPSDATGSLILDRVQLKQGGEYTCVATNSRRSKNITYEVSVLAPPKIYYTKKEFRGVNGDMQLRIPCNATGNPKPDIVWSAGGLKIASGSKWYDISAEGSLIIKNLDRKSTGFYTCTASNRFRSIREDFSVVVDEYPYPGLPMKEINLKKGDSAMIPCNVPQKKTDRLLWFKDGRLLPSSDLVLYNVTESDSAIYTCRVSSVDQPAQSGSTRVEVGFEPGFEHPEDDKEIYFAYGEEAIMDCSATGLPDPEVKWYHDGKEINLKEYVYYLEMINDNDKGHYTCVVSNSHGSAQQDFVVSSFECLLDVNRDFKDNEPLMLTTSKTFPNFKTSNGYMRIPNGETINLVCPSRFNKIGVKETTVTCEKEQTFKQESTGRRFTYSDLKCRDKWQPTVKRTGRLCSKRNSELFQIGFKTKKSFHMVYEVCYDQISKSPIYTKLYMQPTLADIVTNNDPKWFNLDAPVDLDGSYDCSYQNVRTSEILNKDFHRDDGCCFAKRMLVNPLDVGTGLQSATYSHLNAVPHWSTCDSKNWESVERRIRSLVVSADRPLQVYSGSSYNLELPDAFSDQRNVVLNKNVQVPRYLWKVVQDPANDASLAIIQVNVPDLELADAHKYKLCTDVCKETEWMQSSRWRVVQHGFTYCCRLLDFERAFKLRGVFPIHKKLLKEVSAIPEDQFLHAAATI